MRHFLFTIGLTALATTTASAVPASSLPAAAKQDMECFVLYTIAAGKETDEKRKTGAIAGTWYFLGRLDAAAPGLDLESAMRTGITDLQSNPKAREIGDACDEQFTKRGSDLVSAGKKIQEGQ